MRAGVDLGGTKIDVLVLEGERDVIGRARQPTPTEGGAAAVVAAIARAVEDAAADAAVGVGELTGVGVGSPGAVDPDAGTVGFNSNLAGGWSEPYPLPRIWLGSSGQPSWWRTMSRSPRRRSRAWRGPRPPILPCCLVGDRARRLCRSRRSALGREWRFGRAGPHRGQARRPGLSLRPSWLRRGVCRSSGDGGAGATSP